MDTLLRWLAEWKGRRKAAQIIVFDGGAEVERLRSFGRGALMGIGVSLLVFVLSAPTSSDPQLLDQLDRQEQLLSESQRRLEQAVQVASLCVNTANTMERTLTGYQSLLGNRPPPELRDRPAATAP